MLFEPLGSVTELHAATPPLTATAAHELGIPLPENATVPCESGITAPVGALIVALKVTVYWLLFELFWNANEGFRPLTSAVELAPCNIVIVVVPLFTLTFGSPLYAATMLCAPAVSD